MQGLNNDWRARVVFENLALDRIEFEQEQDMTRFVLKFS